MTTTSLDTLLAGRRRLHCRPWPRVQLDAAAWERVAAELAAGTVTLLDLWGDEGAVHMALLDPEPAAVVLVSLECPNGRFPSVGRVHAPAQRLERAARDLWGLEPAGLPDGRRWLDHGRWGLRHPLGDRAKAAAEGDAYAFLPCEGESLHEIPVGPVHAGIIEPGHFRFTANGEAVVRLEERLGYVHKGVDSLLAGAPLGRAAHLAGRISGDSTVAYSIAFARAVEAALGIEAPPRAAWLRALMGELERMANHLGDIGAVCNDAAFALMLAHCGALRERVLRGAHAAFGHRLMMDRVVPGGIAAEPDAEGLAALRRLLRDVRDRFPYLVNIYSDNASLQNRTQETGVLDAALMRRFAPGGFIGRASGRDFDARRAPGYPPYHELFFAVPVLRRGDVNARVWIRIREVGQSVEMIEQILDEMPAGPSRCDIAAGEWSAGAEGVALVEGFRGDVLAWVRLGDGETVARARLRDPSWFQWPLLEAAIEGNIVADFPLCNKSFNCSYSGHDL